jgi:hypothetical protein
VKSRKEAIYGEIPQPHDLADLVRTILMQAGLAEPPIKATRTVIDEHDPGIAEILNEGRPGIWSTLTGWAIYVDNETPSEQLEKLGITRDQLYEGSEAEERKRSVAVQRILANNPEWRTDRARTNTQLRATPGGDLFAPMTMERAAGIYDPDEMKWAAKTRGTVVLTDLTVLPRARTEL